jgi:hypothetical protein
MTLEPNLVSGVITSFVPMARDKRSPKQMTEAVTRIKINQLPGKVGWRYLAEATDPACSTRDFKPAPKKYRTLIPDDSKGDVSLNQ